ncbi:MAG TPA: cupredoxin domain-containing protein [Nitrososphaera sp.]|nr:cupredoxin domain-containing protein [Nitrososphaera sp.]
MVWKIVLVSITIAFGFIIIGGAIIATLFLSNLPNFNNDNDDGENDNGDESSSQSSNLGQDSSLSAVEDSVRILDNEADNSYIPNSIEVSVGEVVTWVNEDSSIHTATSIDGTFDSDILRRGQTYNFTFGSVGEYPYFCTLHPDMVGRVIVTQ